MSSLQRALGQFGGGQNYGATAMANRNSHAAASFSGQAGRAAPQARPGSAGSQNPPSSLLQQRASGGRAGQSHGRQHGGGHGQASSWGRGGGRAPSGRRPPGGHAASPHGGAQDRCHRVGDRAETNQLYKTEMCRNIVDTGFCRFGSKCIFAHSEQERKSQSVDDMLKEERLCRPCPIHIMTGNCPYGHRCKYIHDVNVTSFESTNNIMFEHLLKPKKRDCDTTIPPDRLYHRIINSITQSNPLVDPRKWKHCRPKSSPTAAAFDDTCKLVWNSAPVFPGSGNADCELASLARVAGARRASGGDFSSYSNIVAKNNPQVSFTEVHKLGIVLHMRATNDAHVDFTYAPVNYLHEQPCMMIQARYYRLLDPRRLTRNTVTISDYLAEVSYETYRDRARSPDDTFICAHELAFDSKCKESSNLSIWFNATVTTTPRGGKRLVTKKDDLWQTDDKSGALFLMPLSNSTFSQNLPPISPYVAMQPVDDLDESHLLVRCILESRIEALVRSQGIAYQRIGEDLDMLEQRFNTLSNNMKRWMWPTTSNFLHFSKKKEDQHLAVYDPPPAVGTDETIPKIWKTFMTNISRTKSPGALGGGGGVEELDSPNRLSVFGSLTSKVLTIDDGKPLLSTTTHEDDILNMSPVELVAEETWREILLKDHPDGPFQRAFQARSLSLAQITA